MHITENGEVENIKRYLEETTAPGMISYVVLFTLGRPIGYYTAKGPITDCNKELTPMNHPDYVYVNGSNMDYTADSPNDEGTYGSSNGQCHFFYTEDGQLIRWTGEFLASDKPIRLSEKPLVINVESGKYAGSVVAP